MPRPSANDRAHARAFFAQARHDLEDAEILFERERWPGTVRAAQAAAEKALKAAMFLRLRVPAATLTIQRFGHYVSRWVQVTPPIKRLLGARLCARIDALEAQVPKRSSDNRNPEYPFGPPPGLAPPDPPAAVYARRDADAAIETARRTIAKIARAYRGLA